jgi:hypothetical protein
MIPPGGLETDAPFVRAAQVAVRVLFLPDFG